MYKFEEIGHVINFIVNLFLIYTLKKKKHLDYMKILKLDYAIVNYELVH